MINKPKNAILPIDTYCIKLMKTWLNPIYKRLAESELGTNSHTSGIVPTKETESYFGVSATEMTGRIQTINIEFWYKDNSKIIKTHVNFHKSKTHNHPHLTGNLLPTYKSFGAKKGDILVFWALKEDPTYFKAELIKPGESRWEEITKSNNNFPKPGGFLKLPPPGIESGCQLPDEDESEYQTPIEVGAEEYNASDFPPEKRKSKLATKQRLQAPRNPAKGNFVLKQNNYKCEVDQNHQTFITPKGFPYMEKHHLIPMQFYDEYEYNLDDISNIVCICPTCHRKIHHGKKTEIAELLTTLWEKHKDSLRNSHLEIELTDLKKRYSIS